MNSTDSFSSFESVGLAVKKEKNKSMKRRKIRRLAENKDDAAQSDKKMPPKTRILRRFKLILLGIAIIISVIPIFTNFPSEKPKILYKNFVNSYKRQYYQIVYGRQDYCNKELYTETLMQRIRPVILNQDSVLRELSIELEKNKHMTSIALVGSSGVGKTLLARALQQNFPWSDNVHTYAWNTYVSDHSAHYNLIKLYINGLSDCGRNLLIIDNLTPCDTTLIPIIQEQLSNSVRRAQHIIVIYIFNLNTLEPDDVFEKHISLVQNLNVKTIYFRQFDFSDLYDCIEHESKLENVTLNSYSTDQILKTIDVKNSGCKNVRAKVLLYGKRY